MKVELTVFEIAIIVTVSTLIVSWVIYCIKRVYHKKYKVIKYGKGI